MVWHWYKRRKPGLIDAGLAAMVLAPTIAWTTEPGNSRGVAVAFSFAQVLPLLLRRRFPLVVLGAVLGASVATELSLDVFPAFALALALYTVASHSERRVAAVAGVTTLAVLAAMPIRVGNHGDRDSFFHLVIFAAAAWILGDNLRTKRAYYRELEERAERLEREQEERAALAAADEQARIARELHDVIAHSVSVMVVQAAAASEVFDRQPERARESLRSIEESGRSAMTELRRLLGVVRTGEKGARAPQPGLETLETLAEQVRSTGLAVELELNGDLSDLPAGVDLSAFRIVQEALTNTLKHAQATRVDVVVRRKASGLEIEVSDDGGGPPAENGSDGHGLIGMSQRAELLGGVVEAGAGASGGFTVKASFPLGEEAAAAHRGEG